MSQEKIKETNRDKKERRRMDAVTYKISDLLTLNATYTAYGVSVSLLHDDTGMIVLPAHNNKKQRFEQQLRKNHTAKSLFDIMKDLHLKSAFCPLNFGPLSLNRC